MLRRILHSSLLALICLERAVALTPDLNTCKALLEAPSKVFVDAYRQSHIFPVSPEIELKTEKFGYRIHGSLGQSTASVYLASDFHTGKLVVIKHSRSTLPVSVALSSLWRELAVTHYLLENGEEAPRILKTAIDESGVTIIAKEYFEGLTGQELKAERQYSFSSLPKELSEDAWNSLEPERERLKNLFALGNGDHPPFRTWYDSNLLKLTAQYPEIWGAIRRLSSNNPDLKSKIEQFVYVQDFGIQNMLYDTVQKKWFAFDP